MDYITFKRALARALNGRDRSEVELRLATPSGIFVGRVAYLGDAYVSLVGPAGTLAVALAAVHALHIL